MNPTESNRRAALREKVAAARERAKQDPFWQRPGWVAAETRMRSLFAVIGVAPFSPDAVTAAATQLCIPFDFVLLRNPWRSNPVGKGTKTFEALSEAELFDSVFEEHPPTPGPIWFIPDDCFDLREPYLARGESLREFVLNGPCSLHHDVLFIWAETPRVSLIHHEGCYTHIFLPDEPVIRETLP